MILIQIYEFVCERYEIELKYYCERLSNNCNPEFTDQEIITIYLFCNYEEQRFKIKDIYNFAANYLQDWFPKLKSYTAFSTRLNSLNQVFIKLFCTLVTDFVPKECSAEILLLDSMPIITCSGKRNAKVALELVDKSFCSSKNLWYYGVKLHALNLYNKGTLPHPQSILITKASENDLNVFKENWAEIASKIFFGDKIYYDNDFFKDLYLRNKAIMYTPIKGVKGKSEELKQRDFAYETLFSKAVSGIRQPIESFFNWIIEKTQIQKASKIRSSKGLIVHIFGKLTACFLKPIFNP
jgi:hypothetical protein